MVVVGGGVGEIQHPGNPPEQGRFPSGQVWEAQRLLGVQPGMGHGLGTQLGTQMQGTHWSGRNMVIRENLLYR